MVHELTKCCRPDCNTYEVGLNGVLPCSDCQKLGVRAARPPMRPVPLTPFQRAERIAQAVKETGPIVEAYARTAVDVYKTVQRVKRTIRRVF